MNIPSLKLKAALSIVAGAVAVAVGVGVFGQTGETPQTMPLEEPSFTPGKAEVQKEEFPYGEDPAQTLDVYYRDDQKNTPIVVLVHGGVEEEGDKSRMTRRARAFTDMGYTVIAPNYRYGANLDSLRNLPPYDLACAVATFNQYADRFHANPDKVLVMGFSFGGWVSSFMVYDQEWNWLEGCPVQEEFHVSGFIGEGSNYGNLLSSNAQPTRSANQIEFTGPSELLEDLDIYHDISTPRDGAINHVDPNDPPAFFLHGDADPKFNEQRPLDFAAQIGEVTGVTPQVIVIPGGGHGSHFYDKPELLTAVTQFTKNVFGL